MHKIEKGQTIEYLTLLEPTQERERGYVVWKCRCICGETVYVSSKKLKRGTVISCGCIRGYKKRNQNLLGIRCGNLTVDALTEKKDSGGRRLWHLVCDCGGEVWMTTGDINRQKRLHCGCQNTYNQVPLYGYQTGMLTAKYPTDKRTKQGSVIWKCECQCGNEAEVSENALLHRNQISCGCKKKEAMQSLGSRLHRIDGTCIERLGQKNARPESKTGVCGVHMTKGGRYIAYIGFKGQQRRLGTYNTVAEATRVRLKAVEEIHRPFIEAYKRQE